MANDQRDVLHADEWVMDRYLGDETNTLEPDPKMTIVDRMDRFLAAEYELGRAEVALQQGVNKFERGGEYEDIVSAIATLKASAEYHASQVDTQELDQAVQAQDIDESEAAALLDRLEQASQSKGVEMNGSYYDELESRMEDYQDQRSDFDQNASRDEGQER